MENNRTKILLGLLGAAAVLAIGSSVVPGMIESYKSQGRTLQKLQKEEARLIDRKTTDRPAAVGRWTALVSRTLSHDPREVQNILNQELTALAKESGIQRAAVRPLPIREDYRRMKGVVLVRFTVLGTGPVTSVTRFLASIHQQPYHLRASKVVLNRAGGSNGGDVRMTATIESIALPRIVGKNKAAPWRKFVENQKFATLDLPENAADRKNREPVVLARAIADYDLLALKQPFQGRIPPLAPQAAPKPPPPPPPPVAANTESATPAQPPKPPKPRITGRDPSASMILSGILTSPTLHEIVVRNAKRERLSFELGDNLELIGQRPNERRDHGVIVLIHPYGVVTELEGERRFYALGSRLSDYQTLDVVDPAIRAALTGESD